MAEWMELNDPDVPQLEGLEMFVGDDVALDIIRYAGSFEWHWMVRRWEDDGICSIEASYDGGGCGYPLMTSALDGLLSHLKQVDPNLWAQLSPQRKNILASLLNKAVEIGLAVAVSAVTVFGAVAANPAVALACDDSGTYVECADGSTCRFHTGAAAYENMAVSIVDDADTSALEEALSKNCCGYDCGSGLVTLEVDEDNNYQYDHILAILDSGQYYRIYDEDAARELADILDLADGKSPQRVLMMDSIILDNLPLEEAAQLADEGVLPEDVFAILSRPEVVLLSIVILVVSGISIRLVVTLWKD